jgi:putative transposase
LKEKRELVQPESKTISVRKQCELLSLSRSSYYSEEVGVSEEDQKLMRRIDEIYLKHPFFGSRTIVLELAEQQIFVNRKKVQRLMQLMGIMAMVPGPHTSVPNVEHKIYPYLMGRIDVVRANQAWATDITYIPTANGYCYLVAIMDWRSRAILSWRISNTMTVDFAKEALEEAIQKYGVPEIFNSDQGAQFTSEEFTKILKREKVTISMDGKGRCIDNIFMERVWRSLKYEEVYLNSYATMSEAQKRIGEWIEFYNTKRFHSALSNQKPMNFYWDSLQQHEEAA